MAEHDGPGAAHTPHEWRHGDPRLLRVVESLEKAVEQLTSTVEILKTAMFGRWDAETNTQVPGVRDDIKTLGDRVKGVETKIALALKWGWIPLTFVVLSAAGVPTKDLFPLLAKAIEHALGG